MDKIGILCAGDDELAPFIPLLQDAQLSEKAMLTFYQGSIEGVPAVALYSGVCKVNAAVAAQLLIDTYGCGAVINAGTAGAVAKEREIFDTVVATAAAYHDVEAEILTDFHPWLPDAFFQADKGLLELAKQAICQYNPPYPVVFGKMVTGERFIDDEEKRRIADAFHPMSVDMESASVAHVCYVNRIPFLAVRTMTDLAEGGAQALFEQNCRKAAAQSADFVRLMLKALRQRRA